MQFKLSDSEIGKCYRFAYHVTKQTDKYYKRRNEYASTEKLISDNFIAKLSELYVFYFLSSKDYVCSYPDFRINENNTERRIKYSNDIDLLVFKNEKQLNIHIKCVRFDSPVKDSWLVQKNNSIVESPKENDFFALCVFHSPEKIEVKKIIKANKIKWKKTKMKLDTKRACYLNDLEV
tara:strand:- start:29399 stop:29932 length:534 start_codon:yes stop_codon:yes gene_type:complete